ncbi:unnamed protein product [Closterium sp. NIES-64]|nr:unnamed protein product [Closterium sp. NIES-64]
MPNAASTYLKPHAAAAAVKAALPHHLADAVTAIHAAPHHATAAATVGTGGAVLPYYKRRGKPREEEAGAGIIVPVRMASVSAASAASS